MGQRLVLSVTLHDKDIAKIYYHWSAYTESALREASEVVNCICKGNYTTEKELQLALIRMCEENGGGVDIDDREYVRQLFPGETFSENADRNYGLVALSENGMTTMQRWSEGDIEVNIDEEEVVNSVFFCFDNYTEYVQYMTEEVGYEKDDLPKLEDIPTLTYDPATIDFANIDLVADELQGESVVQCDGMIYELIY